MLYIDKEGRPYNRNICCISAPKIKIGGSLGELGETISEGFSTLGSVAQDVWDHWTGKDKTQVGTTTTAETDAVEEVDDNEEAGDELRPKQGTNVGIPVVYGNRSIGGTLIYQEVSSDSLNLYQCWALAEGVQQQWSVIVDNTYLSVSDYWRNSGTNNWDKLIWCNGGGDGGSFSWGSGIGNDAGIPDPVFGNALLYGDHPYAIFVSGPRWSEDHKMKGIACEQITYRRYWDQGETANGTKVNGFGPSPDGCDNPDTLSYEVCEGVNIWQSGLPKLSFSMEGIVIKDSAGVTAHDKDPAWILYEYLTNERYGCSIPTDEIDATSFVTASAICMQVKTGFGTTTKRHECNIILDTKKSLLTNIKRILATCNGRLHWINGLYTMKIDDALPTDGTRPNFISFTFLESHIIGGISIDGASTGERLNQVTAKFINPANDWKSDEARYPEITKDLDVYNAFLSADNDVKHTKTINVGGVTDYNQARFLAKQACLRSRDSLKVSFTTTAEAMNVIVGDVVTITHSTPGWTAKEFLVRTLNLNADGSCSLSCIEHNDAIYEWITVEIPVEAQDTNLPDPSVVTAPIGMIVAESIYSTVASAGKRVAVSISWTSTGIFTTSHDVEYKLSVLGNTAATIAGSITSTSIWTNGGSTISKSILLQDFEIGYYDFRVRARNANGSISEWLIQSNVEIEGITTPPENVTGFTVSNHGTNVVITVDQPDDPSDISHAEISILQEDSVIIDDAIPVATIAVGNTSTVIPAQGGGGEVADEQTYVAVWVNSAGIKSTDYLAASSIASYGSELVATFAEQPAWAGTLDGFYETEDSGTVLRFLGSALWDSVTEPMDSWVEIDGLGGRTSAATYTGIPRDLGAVLPARIYTNKIFTSQVTDGSNYMDLWGKTDLRTSWDQVEKLDNLSVQIRVTGDDPADGGATWTNYKEFLIIDVVARGYQLRVVFDEFDENSQFTLRELELLVDMVQKFEGDRAQTATEITYDTAFYTTPDLIVTPVNMVSGDWMAITNEDKDGFDIDFKNSSGGVITRNYNYIAKGV